MSLLRLSVVLITIAFGGTIYVLFRERTLVLFDVVDWLGGASAIDRARSNIASWGGRPPEFVVSVFPDGCWAFASSFFFASIWRGQRGRARWVWTALVPAIGVVSEVGQLVGAVPGTFDALDVAAFVGGGVAGALLAGRRLWYDQIKVEGET